MKKRLICLGLVAMFGCMPALMAGAIYQWKDANGGVHIGDQPPDPSRAQQIAVRVNTYKGSAVEGQENALNGSEKKVVIYTTSHCGYCKKAKAWFGSRGVAYTEYDVENSTKGQRDYKKLGGRGVPIILVGKQRLNGFSEGRLGAALRKAGYTL
ncbi:MAG: glutaredoxin family protein [Pseudomonadota bacterium]|nr:glutaredoxin family protein [Pseudomonadota bacterium]